MAKNKAESVIPRLLSEHESKLLDEWVHEQTQGASLRPDLLSESELRRQSADFLALLTRSAQAGDLDDIDGPEWKPVRQALESVSQSRAERGFSPSEVAVFIFSFKQPLFRLLQEQLAGDGESILAEVWRASRLLDLLGLYTTESYIRSRDRVIDRQRQEMLELSTPVVKLWEGVLALPMIGTLDSERAQVVMESLLERIVETGATVAIVDITGVPTVDTLVAQHLLKTVAAAQLMGAECIISGIRPQIAQTIVHLGIDLKVSTKASLADALSAALKKTGHRIEAA